VKQEIKKILLKYLENSLKVLDVEARDKILAESRNILDNDKQIQLSKDL
jgi:hypothetical protein